MSALLRLESLEVSYGAIRAVRDLSLTVDEGEIVVLLGPNGAGKSSTLASITGLVRASAGRIIFDGAEVRRLTPEERVRRGIALTPEGRRIFSTLTVHENLRIGGVTRRGRDHSGPGFDELLALFPVLGQRLHDPAGNLSGGEQQQLAIARSLMSRPRLLLLDEPSLGLAPIVAAKVLQTICTLRDSGVTILLVEQQVEQALQVADRGYVLVSGSLELEGPADELRRRGDLERAYLGIRR